MKRLRACLLGMVLALLLLPAPARADVGPKPSVRVTFENMDGALCYGTLLSKWERSGPASAWDGQSAYQAGYAGPGGYDIWTAFVEYQDGDGFYFLQQWWECSKTGQLIWGYHPPSPFKILLYYPDTDTFLVSGVHEHYAFDSYYTVDLSDINADVVQTGQPSLTARRSYDYRWELLSLAARAVITILVELALALLMGLRGKASLLYVAKVNIITQLLLNVVLNIIDYNSGPYLFVFCYVLLELLVIAIESLAYSFELPALSGGTFSKWRCFGYAWAANACSFVAGMVVAGLIPGIF